jgi:hypothetical protein
LQGIEYETFVKVGASACVEDFKFDMDIPNEHGIKRRALHRKRREIAQRLIGFDETGFAIDMHEFAGVGLAMRLTQDNLGPRNLTPERVLSGFP